MWDNAQIGGVSLFLKDYHLKAYSSTAEKAVLDAPMNLLSASLMNLCWAHQAGWLPSGYNIILHALRNTGE